MKHSRIIPKVMFSQHPDNATAPFWQSDPFIKTHAEIQEAHLMYSEFSADEVMWDWEGKLVDEAVIERFLGEYGEFFHQQQLGKDLFLTFRIPNPRIESGYRLARAFMVILSAQHTAQSAGFPHQPLFEIILPMTETAKELLSLHHKFARLQKHVKGDYGSVAQTDHALEVIPLFESVDVMLNSKKILKRYLTSFQKKYGQPAYLRPFFARSDPAMNSGIVPTTLAIKWALSGCRELSTETGVLLYPIIAPGSLPFRGGLTPDTALEFAHEFAGVKTVVIQSAFRYDYPAEIVKASIQHLKNALEKSEAQQLTATDFRDIKKLIGLFEPAYKVALTEMAPWIQQVAAFVPKRRERVQHVGLFGYSREVGKLKMPRAIGFTAAGYSLGIPPEFFGTGIGLAAAQQKKLLPQLEALYPTLRSSLERAGRYLRKESIAELGVQGLTQEVAAIEKYLGHAVGPVTTEEKQHAELVGQIIASLKSGGNPRDLIEKSAILRKGIG